VRLIDRLFVLTMAFVHVRSISHLVQDRLGVSPEPRKWPKQSAKAKREQADALNGLGLRMPFLFRNFFRQDMHHPKSNDADDWSDDEHDPRDAVRNCIERLTVKNRRVRVRRQRQQRENNEQNETSVAKPASTNDGLYK